MKDSILEKDISLLAEYVKSLSIRGKKILITGATGLIGSQIVKALLEANRLFDTEITVVAMVRSEEKAKLIFSEYDDEKYLKYLKQDILEEIKYEDEVDYVIHGASATSSKFFVSHPVDTIKIAMEGTTNILNYAVKKKVSGFLYLSSLEVYGVPDGKKETISETDYGYIDPLNVRSSYSEGKRMVECLVVSYASQYGLPAKIARLSQVFGPGVDYHDGRVFAEFARSVIEGKDIILHTTGKTVRTYCYTRDAIAALFKILLSGQVGEAYNVTNPTTACSIYEMAELAKSLDETGKVQVVIDLPKDIESFGYNPEMIICLDASKLEHLGFKAEVGMKEMLKNTILSMANRR